MKPNEVGKFFDNWIDDIEEQVDVALRKGLEETTQEVKANAPVKSGRLRDSIRLERHGDLEYTIVAGAPYAADVEFGTMNSRGHHFFYPTIETRIDGVIDNVKKAIK